MEALKNEYKVLGTYTLVTPVSQFELFLLHVWGGDIEEFWEVKINRGYLDVILQLNFNDGIARLKYYNKLENGVYYHTINLDNGEVLSGLLRDEKVETINCKWLLNISEDVKLDHHKKLRGI